MTEFGQSSPATPQAYSDTTTRVFTKAGLLSHVVRALETVGMVPLRGLWPWDPTAEPEYALPDQSAPSLFPFDYPDSSTFTVNNELWRPCVVVAIFHGDYNAVTGASESWNDFLVFDAIRLDGSAHLDDIYITNRHRNPATLNFGFGRGLDTSGRGYDMGGAFIRFVDWKPFAAHGGSFNVNELTVSNIYAYLGRAGLFLYLGTGTQRAQFGSHLALGFIFAGGRIAGRELTLDVNLNRSSPIVPLYLTSSSLASTGDGNSLGQWKTDEQRYESIGHGIQYDLKSQLLPVTLELYNLENVEHPIFPFYKPWTAPSPREVSGGGGAHILGRLLVVPTHREDNEGDLYGPLENSLSTDQVRPQWGDVFTAPGFRWSDLAAPLGLNEDPITLLDWFIVPTYNSNSLMALYYENATVVSALATLVKTLHSDDYYTLAGVVGFDFASLAGGLTAPVVTTASTSVGWAEWDDTDAGDLAFLFNDPAAGDAVENATMEWVVTAPSGDPVDAMYEIEFEARNRDDASTEGLCLLEFDVFIGGTWVEVLSLASAGTNTGLPGYNFATYTFGLAVDLANTAARTLKFRWVSHRNNSGTEGNTASIQNVHIKKYQYV